MTNVAAVNRALRRENLPYEIVKGEGYFWFDAMNDDTATTGIPSLYTMTLRYDTAEGIVGHVREHHYQWLEQRSDS